MRHGRVSPGRPLSTPLHGGAVSVPPAAIGSPPAVFRVLLAAIATVLIASGARALSWDITAVDGPGDVGWYASIALDPSGNPGISYYASPGNDLRFARLAGGAWQIETVDAQGDTGWYTSLAFDSAGNPRIAYWDLTNSALRYARWTGSSWSKETVDNSAYVGQCCSLALDSAGNPMISYYDYTNGDLKFARWTGSAWAIEVVDSGPAQLGAGLYTSLAIDSMGRPHISYADHSQGLLRYAWWNGTSWILETVDGGTPIGTSIRLDSADVPHISYAYQFGQGSHLKYAERTGPGGTWQTQIVRPGGQRGWYSSLCLRSDGAPRILSWDLGGGIVDYDSFDNGAWVHDTVESMGYTDQWCSLTLDSGGRPLAAYRSATNQDLHYAVGTDPAAAPDPVAVRSALEATALRIWPNPSRGAAVVRVHLGGGSRVGGSREGGSPERGSGEGSSRAVLRIVDALGRQVVPPIECRIVGGIGEAPLPASLVAGVYFVRAEVGPSSSPDRNPAHATALECAIRFVRAR